MMTLGVDAHKQIHVAVAVDERGRALEKREGSNTEESWEWFLNWGRQWEERRWGIEGTGNYGRGLAHYLVGAGERVYEVNPRLTAQSRRRARRSDKSDRLDALAVARVVLREEDELPLVVAKDDEAEALDVLSRERRRIKSQVDRLRNQLHQALFQADPQYRKAYPSLSRVGTVRRLEEYTSEVTTAVMRARVSAVRRIAAMLRMALEQMEELTPEIEQLTRSSFGHLTELQGVGLITAGKLAGILGTRRFASEEGFAAYAGAAPLETSSAGRVRHRLNRSGNRRLNSVLYMMALTQWSHGGQGRHYIERKMSEGRSWLEAVRALKRYMARRIWRLWERHYGRLAPAKNPSV